MRGINLELERVMKGCITSRDTPNLTRTETIDIPKQSQGTF